MFNTSIIIYIWFKRWGGAEKFSWKVSLLQDRFFFCHQWNEAKRESGWLGMIRDDTGAGLASHMKCFSSLFAALWVQLFGSVTQWFLFQAQWWLHEVAWARGVEDWRTECASSVSVTRGRGLRIKVVKGGVRWGHGASAVLCKVPPLCSILHTAVESHGM